ncbi:MAG: helix-turn-helix transcriptional regulator [Candidatus Riflebacteria bacterium]|nr:helix-turn-helix transcriptional regulator [Candidatus Riflebacteria bacterium]
MSKYRTDELDRLAAMFKGLSNPQRLRIFLELTACCKPGTRWAVSPGSARRCAGDLGKNLGLAASTVSHHLKELRQAGLMLVERRGQRIECRVSADAVRRLARFFGEPGGRARGGLGGQDERSEGPPK